MVFDITDSGTQQNTRRRKKSIVWEHFTVKTDGPGCAKAYCKRCKRSFAYLKDSKQAGTSHLKRHISLGICQKSQQTPCSKIDANPPKKQARAKPCFAAISFDQASCNNKIAKMIILHDYPLHIVEHQGFINFVRTLQPQFNPLSFNTVQEDCVAMFLREKQNVLNLINGIPGQVNLTLDLWTSNQTSAYVFLRGHFIDGDWNLHHPILNVLMVPFPDSDGSLNQNIVNCLSDWHLEGRLFTLALDKFFFNEALMGNLRCLLSIKNPVILNGQLLSQNCYARVLSRLALDALSAMRETVDKVRVSVKYMKSSKFNEGKFLELRQQLQVSNTMDLLIDDQNKWDTIYHMLAAACELKEVFACFDASDPDYRVTLTMDDWKQVETLCTYLKYLYDAANILTVQAYPTANLFFPEVSKLQVELTRAAFSQDPFCSRLIMPLQEKFDQYWRESCFILAVAVVMDPRYKMKLVKSTFAKIFGENADEWIRIVEDGLNELFLEYNIIQVLPFTTTNGHEGNEAMIKTEPFQEVSLDGSLFTSEDGLSDFEFYISDFTCNQQFKSELDEYLEEPLEPRVQEFNILSWWRINGLKYPTLSRLASDILSMPASTLSADSVFDMDIKKMDSYRSSLDSLTLEALICTKDWFQYKSLPGNVSNALVKVEH
ncbi:zinc finger BED domain-containing protein DAYSLEEPER-like [Abrus precatorius]|uniref:Zinc finger BED domain-containing protein DAYSLEEPER-like n=1 Tax=Abrus precatorius TaxID=3816 RepID=A0A8B8KC09_ABRPR|nr:zinc finger BED domain-containing protein DAYSLEEPER-like [Abrus precatorius]